MLGTRGRAAVRVAGALAVVTTSAGVASAAEASASVDANAVQPRVDFAKLEARGFYVAPNPDQLAVQQRLRGDFGLDTSAERIASLADAEDTAVYLGVVGTREELALVDRQMSIQAKRRFGSQRGVTVASRSQLGLPA